MKKLLKIDNVSKFKEDKELFLKIASRVLSLIYYGGEVVNFKGVFDLTTSYIRWEGSGARLFDKDGLYTKLDEFEYLIIDLEGVHDLPEYLTNLSELIEDILEQKTEE